MVDFESILSFFPGLSFVFLDLTHITKIVTVRVRIPFVSVWEPH